MFLNLVSFGKMVSIVLLSEITFNTADSNNLVNIRKIFDH